MDHGYAVFICILHYPKDHKSEEAYQAIAVEGAIWPNILPDAKDRLVHYCKMEEFHLNIKTLLYRNVCKGQQINLLQGCQPLIKLEKQFESYEIIDICRSILIQL